MTGTRIFHAAPAVGKGLIPAQFVIINLDGVDKVVPLPRALNFLNKKLTEEASVTVDTITKLQKQVDELTKQLDGVYHFNGEIPNFDYLPKSPQKGDSYKILHSFALNEEVYPAGTTIFWTGTTWEAFSGKIELDESLQQDIIDKLTPNLKALVEEAISDKLNWYQL